MRTKKPRKDWCRQLEPGKRTVIPDLNLAITTWLPEQTGTTIAIRIEPLQKPIVTVKVSRKPKPLTKQPKMP